MPTKTDRILSYLPPTTYLTSPRPAVLYPLVDAFGNELLLGENSLAEIMLAHWVDFADKNQPVINDLAKLAALYGLVPFTDESGDTLETVEEFREHLKRYVRTFLEGTVTVQGILRVTAETLGLRIADAPEELDRWWARKKDAVIAVEALRNDARNLLNFDRLCASGTSASSARVIGTADLSQPVDLHGTNLLRVMVDGVFDEIDLTDGLPPGTKLSLDQIVEIINKALHPVIATRNGNSLTLTSPKLGSSSSLELVNGDNDAAPVLLGLPPRTYHGTVAAGAQFRGTVDLSNKIDLSNERYLRIEVDRKFSEEIDCAGANALQTTLAEIRNKINNAFPGKNVASDDGKHLILTSPSKGFDSSISVQAPAAQNACEKIFGVPSVFATGRDAQPARVVSTRDLRGRVDLSKRSKLQLRIDGGNALTINCAGVEPARTERVEIVAAINTAAGATVGVITENSISLVSPTTGLSSEIVFEEPPDDDATFDLFGIGPQSFRGNAATTARLIASPPLTDNGIDVRANNFLLLSVDGGTPVEIDLRKATDDVGELRSLPLDKAVAHINKSLGAQVASTDGTRLFLASTRTGAPGKVEVFRREITRERRFVTRATVVDEAAREIFGFVAREAVATPAVSARLVGSPDLSQTIDLKNKRFLRLRVDGLSALEIDAAGARARATTLDEIISTINTAAKAKGVSKDVAGTDGKHLIVTSPSAGADSHVEIEPPHGALDKVLGIEPGVFKGVDATSLKFSSIPDLTGGINLPANAAIKLSIDDAAAVEIKLTDAAPAKRTTVEIVSAINGAFASAAKTDGRRIELRSTKQGVDSKIRFETPAGTDVTKQVFGITAPREYHGAAATPARVVGVNDLSGATDLSTFRFLNIAIDGVAQTLDCAAKAAKPEAATLAEIVASIGPDIASADGNHLALHSSATGANARLEIKPLDSGDASTGLFGSSPRTATGTAASPAVITGEKNLVTGVNLGRRSLLRLAVDGGRPIDIDVAGTVPASTASDEIVDKINAVFPNLAAMTDDNQLQLTSTTATAGSKVSLQPLRFLEVIEYQPVTSHFTFTKNHNGSWTIVNDGVADSFAEIRITATKGAVGPAIVNSGVNWSVHLFVVLERGETARIFRDERLHLRAEIIGIDGKARSIPPSQIQSGPVGSQAIVPFKKESWKLTGDQNQLQLNNPNSPDIVVLKSLQPNDDIIVRVTESDISALAPQMITADTENGRLVGRIRVDDKSLLLVDSKGNTIANLIPGPHVDPLLYRDTVVKVEGPIFAGTPPLLRVEKIAALFDVALYCEVPGKPPVKEYYQGVTIGADDGNDSLTLQLNGASKLKPASALVRADQLDKAIVLKVPTGRTLFRYLDCLGPRFEYAHFNRARFPNGNCGERGIFDVSRFSNSPPERIRAVFASAPPLSDPPVTIDFQLEKFGAAAFVVNLPADLPPRFGGRFNESRFGVAAGDDKSSAQVFQNAVAEPEGDPNFLVTRINSSAKGSKFVTAERVPQIELGFAAADMNVSFRKPKFLTLGTPNRPARLYLKEAGLNGFIKLEANENGVWGNEIGVSVREVRPAIYDVSIILRGARFEQARAIVQGLTTETIQEVMKPGPTGVLQAKAAGVRAGITRDRAEFPTISS